MSNQYSQKTLKYFHETPHVGQMDPAAKHVQFGEAGSSAQGDHIKFFLRMHQNRIETARFQAYGGVATVASAEFLAAHLEGQTLEEAADWSGEKLLDALDLPPVKNHIVELVLSALKQALQKKEPPAPV